MARYESWKPAEAMYAGRRTSCMVRAVQKVPRGVRSRPGKRLPASFITMNSRARIIEGDAPVAKA